MAENLKVAAYCRVSTEKDDQLLSLQAQKEFFLEYAARNHLELVALYADEGISGTKRKNRKEFNRMMRDAELGKFQCVYVKDVSRLARNVVDFLQSIRRLKALNIDCRFVTANMSTNDGELTLTILAAVAQEESANLSKRVKFGKKRNAVKGRVPNLVYGYDKTPGEYFHLAVNPFEANVVRRMFDLYVNQGYGWNRIAYQLNQEGVRSKRNCQWHPHSVGKLLTNPLYIGKIVNAKSYVKDFLTGKREKNQAQDQIVVERPELAIVDTATFQKAQQILQKRSAVFHHSGERHSNKYGFSTLIKCEACGYSFRRIARQYAKLSVRWACAGRNARGVGFCDNRTLLDEGALRQELCQYFAQLLATQKGLAERTVNELKRIYKPEQTQLDAQASRNALAKLKKAKRKQTEMYEADAITLEELKERVQELNRQIQSHERTLQAAREAGGALEQLDALVRCYCKDIQTLFAEDAVSNAILRKWIEKILVDAAGQVRVQLRLFSEVV